MQETIHSQLTQKYGSVGSKLLSHLGRLLEAQEHRRLRPITVQLAPTEACDNTCSFCSVAQRPQKRYLSFPALAKALEEFRTLGALSLELTGGGNPLLYKDPENRKDINDVIQLANTLGYEVAIITNSVNLKKLLPVVHSMISWIRISLAKLEDGKSAKDFDLNGFPEDKVGFSWIVHASLPAGLPERVAEVSRRFPEARFVRAVNDCTKPGTYEEQRKMWLPIIEEGNRNSWYMKETCDGTPHGGGCYVGLVRPYIAAPPDGEGEYQVYACSSHVLAQRNYDRSYALCSISEILGTWQTMWDRWREKGYPYEVKGNEGKNWAQSCGGFCFYGDNNRLLYSITHEHKDANFA
jgi:hypothetical protein